MKLEHTNLKTILKTLFFLIKIIDVTLCFGALFAVKQNCRADKGPNLTNRIVKNLPSPPQVTKSIFFSKFLRSTASLRVNSNLSLILVDDKQNKHWNKLVVYRNVSGVPVATSWCNNAGETCTSGEDSSAVPSSASPDCQRSQRSKYTYI